MTTNDAPKSFLMAAHMADLSRRPASPKAERLIDDLLTITLEAEAQGPHKRKRRDAKTLVNFRSTIAALVHDLLHAQLNEAAQGFCYLSSRDNSRFVSTAATARQYKAVQKVWQDADLLDYVKGLNHGFAFDDVTEWPEGKLGGKAARLRARTRLVDLAASHGIRPDNLRDHFRVSHDDSYPVTLDKKPIPASKRTPESDAIAEKVRRINKGLERHSFDPPIRPRLYAGFQEDPSRPGELVWGGRLYARDDRTEKAATEDPSEAQGFQQWSPTKRLLLRTDDKPVAEVDIKSSHLTIYHALLGFPVPEGKDLYKVPGVPRELVKHVVTVLFGIRSLDLERWPRLKKEPRNEAVRKARKGWKVQEVVRRVVDALPALRRLPKSGLGWGELQKVEAGILLDVMAGLREMEGIPMLPVHDSLIMPERHVERVVWALSHRFCGVTGVYPMLTIARHGQDEEVWTKKADPVEVDF